jgi:hypothetical protein
MTEQDKIEFLNYAIANAQDVAELPEASLSDVIGSVVAKTSAGDMKLLPYANMKVPTDSALSSTSTNPVQNKVVKEALDAKQNKLTIDSALSSTSANPVQNKVVKAALDAKQDRMTIDSALSATSANPVQNKVVKAALDAKQDVLTAGSGIIINGTTISATGSGGASVTIDSALSSTSANPVQNKVVKAALDEKQDVLTAGSGITINGSEISTAYKIWHGSQAEYDAIAAKDDMTIYLIEES